jgi:DNA polymerase elongation subunit (family B)/Zn-finger nucleic acid-binding protein
MMDAITDMREYDVPYVTRCAIDLGLRVGAWYQVGVERGKASVVRLHDFLEKAEPRVLAFDIECTKAPLKFPDAKLDQVYMISFMVDGQGYLLINREVVSEDVPDFEYTPKKDFPGPFKVENLPTEKEVIVRFFEHCQTVRPQVYVTYNGDFFDWPFLDRRASEWGLSMEEEIGVRESNGEWLPKNAVHMDCLYWVKRDSYLPHGAHGLKAVTKYKLRYNPVEIEPEMMLTMAVSNPRHMASYSVSDAVATYYLYMKYVHNFIFSLCTIIPLPADDVLRKGSGTLCEMLLQVEAFASNVIAPNKQVTKRGATFEGHLLETETYIGGHVECLESGVFRSDIETDWKLDHSAFQELIDRIDRTLAFALEVEEGIERSEVTNYEQVKADIISQLSALRDRPIRKEKPKVYHLDVAAMYPNIILSNRLQPSAVVTPEVCAACDFNTGDNSNKCKRVMDWTWRGEYFPATRAEIEMLRLQVESEVFPHHGGSGPASSSSWSSSRPSSSSSSAAAAASSDGRLVPFHDLPEDRKDIILHQRIKDYCQKTYRRVKDTHVEKREATICQREHPFYIDTVRAFRDRRYEYKGLTKTWTKNLATAERSGDKLAVESAKNRVVLYDSLQLAHKCILNSFYGYVMRKGSRWFSMEMGGVVTHTGSTLITKARELVERIGRPLELDTDGIWCILPQSFPQKAKFTLRNGSSVSISYPCVVLNVDVHDKYTNHQYQTLVDPAKRTYATHSECSIYFEVDGPYKCMVLPASQEEGKLLKKRYAVFNDDGSLAELKGFELKRRGELKIIKIFQSQVFERFLDGSTLEECYANVAAVADYWLDVLYSRGVDLDDEELMDLISEARSMSKTLDEYGAQKSTAISTAKRLAEFLGSEMVKDKGLNCSLLIARKPEGAPVTERAIPTNIFSTDPSIRNHFLRKWCKDPSLTDFDPRSIIDWDYYITRLGSAIQKIITIPAALQRVANPVPRVAHPDWLNRVVRQKNDPLKQQSLSKYFAKAAAPSSAPDIEDLLSGGAASSSSGAHHVARVARPATAIAEPQEEDESDGPSYETDAAEWIARRTKRYARVKRQREADLAARNSRADPKRSALSLAAAPKLRKGLSGGLAGYMEDLADQLSSGYLQVLELRETGAPGELLMWAMTSPTTLQRLLVKVPRKMLVNCVKPVDSLAGRQKEMLLPRGRRTLFLYEIARSEGSFQSLEQSIPDAQSNPLVEGVYESKTPMVFRALMEIGCVVTIHDDEDDQVRRDRLMGVKSTVHRQSTARRRGVLGDKGDRTERSPSHDRSHLEERTLGQLLAMAPGGADGRTFIPDHFNLESPDSCAYLDPHSAVLRKVFVYYHQTEHRGGVRAVCALVFVRESTAQLADRFVREQADGSTVQRSEGPIPGVNVPVTLDCHVFTVNPAAGRADPRPNLEHLFAHINARGDGHPRNGADFFYKAFKSTSSLWKAAARVFRDFSRRSPGPTMLATHSSLSKAALFHALPVLSSFPVCHRTLLGADARGFPALQWQGFACSLALGSLVKWFYHSQALVDVARFVSTPIGNLEDSAWTSACDLLYARLLHYNHHALWCSANRVPDLGGAELRNESDSLLELRPLPRFDWSSGFRSASSSHSQARLSAGRSAAGVSGIDSHVAEVAAAASGTQIDPRASPTVNRPGMYRTVCVEIEISSLAIDTILQAAHILDVVTVSGGLDDVEAALTGADLTAGLIDTDGSSGGKCQAAFRFLQNLVTSWHKHSLETPGGLGSVLLSHVYQWIASPTSKLHDPALHRLLRSLMGKVWQQLLSDLRRLGAVIVNASFDRVVIATPKLDPATACGWVAYVLSSVKAKPLFMNLDLVPSRFWWSLLWLDAANHSALEISDPKLLVPPAKLPLLMPSTACLDDPEREAALGEDPVVRLLHEMNLVTEQGLLLVAQPNEVVESKEAIVEDDEADDEEDKALRRRTRGPIVDSDGESDDDVALPSTASPARSLRNDAPATPGRARAKEPSNAGLEQSSLERQLGVGVEYTALWNIAEFLPDAAATWFQAILAAFVCRPFRACVRDRAGESSSSGSESVAIQAVRRVMEKHIAPRLHTATQELHDEGGDELSFPERPGKHLDYRVPALEMAKSVCFILSLDSAASEEAAKLRKSVLRMLGVADFSPEAVWRDPCLTYVLPDVVCSHCNAIRDLDVCRDPFIRSPTEDERKAGVRAGLWFCPRCSHDYDRGELEETLVDTVQQRSAAYQLQDLYCSKTHDVRKDRLSEISPGSGNWVNSESPERFHESIAVFGRIAEHHGFDWLLEATEWALSVPAPGVIVA